MLRPVSLLPALVVVATLAAVFVAPVAPAVAAAAPQARVEVETPLAVTIGSLSPSTIPKKGPIWVSGEVTNMDDQTWTAIKLYAFISKTPPMTTQAELADAAATPSSLVVGERILDEGTFDEVDELTPGQSEHYSLRIPRSAIDVTEEGVYWFGVHALGADAEGDDGNADGRARTFLPLVGQTNKSVDTALVLPIRREIAHTADGRIAKVGSWATGLAAGGRLRSMVDFGVAAGSRPITWLVDPAVPDAVRQLAAGNQPRSLERTITDEDDDANDDESESPDPSDDPSADDESDDGSAQAPVVTAAAEAGSAWLERLRDALAGNQILTLPYGDVDVAGAATYDPDVYHRARKRSDDDPDLWGLPTSPAVSSPSGYIDGAGIDLTDRDTTLIVTDRLFGGAGPAVAQVDGHTLAVASSGAASGGPGPDDRLGAVAMRQRIVSEAAVRLLSHGRKPLIAVLPSTWAPDLSAGFFEGLDLDWLHLTTLQTATDRPGRPVPAEKLAYPESQVRLELDATNFAAAGDLVQVGDSLQNLLTDNDQVGSVIRDEAFTDTSYSNRLRPDDARVSAERSRRWVEDRLRSVHINGPPAVILSGGSGRFAATITNDLDQPVTVKLEALPDAPLKVSVPADSIDIAPETRATVLLNASSSALGIRNLTLTLTDVKGVPIGSSDGVPIRSNQVSNVIWLILGTGVALLFGAIAVRLFRRIRAAARS